MALTIGIVGLPNVGKSTLFNALTKNTVLAANYPFATIEPNIGVVPLPDERLGVLAEIFGSERILPATVSFVDIAGLVRGASEGEGLGNKFLANIRESDAICQVVRVFTDDDVAHVDGKVDPAGDIETIETELVLADLQTLEKAVPRLDKEVRAKRGDKKSSELLDTALAAQKVLEEGNTLYAAGLAAGVDAELARGLGLLTTKPFIYVFNLDEDQLADEELKRELGASVAPADSVFLNAKLEMDLMDMEPDEALELLAELRRRGVGPGPARPAGLPHARAADVLDRRDRRRLARGPSARGGPRRRPRASSTPTSSVGSSRPRSSRSTTWWRPGRWPPPRRPARCGSRARTTSCRTATSSSSASTYEIGPHPASWHHKW